MRDRPAPVWNSFGGLGPDIDNPISQLKRVARLRVSDYSNQLREINRHTCKPRASVDTTEKVQESARKIALVYSRSIPRPAKPVSVQKTVSNPPASTPTSLVILETLLVEHGKLEDRVAEIRRRYDPTAACV